MADNLVLTVMSYNCRDLNSTNKCFVVQLLSDCEYTRALTVVKSDE